MSVGKKTITYTATALVLAAIIIIGSIFYLQAPGVTSSTSSRSSQIAGLSVLAIQLTDPPQVPQDTRSLNLTYSAVNLLVGEPASNNQVTTSSVSLTPSGGSATVDLLKLQNVSQTIASASLPTGSAIYSVSFTVKSISININGTVYPVTLATGGTTLGVTLAHPSSLDGDSAMLLELNPVVADTPSGYQLIPSMIGILKPHSEFNQGEQDVGSKRQLSVDDQHGLDQAGGLISARLVSLSVSGSTTTLTVQVNNTGSGPVSLIAIGLHGNFTSQSGCPDDTGHGKSGEHSKSGEHGKSDSAHTCDQHNEIVFSPLITMTSSSTTPVSTTTTSTAHVSCSTGGLTLASGEGDDQDGQHGLTIAPGQCLDLTFTGSIVFGQSGPITPSTEAGQLYIVHIIASNDAQMKLGCTLPLSATSCSTVTGEENSD